MSNQTAKRLPVVGIVALLSVSAYAVLLWVQLGTTQDSLAEAQAREARLLEQLQSLAMMRSGDQATQHDPAVEAVKIALLQRPGLIEHEPVLGGTFYFLEDSVRLLSERYVFASFEDGHVMGHMLLELERAADGTIELRALHSYLD